MGSDERFLAEGDPGLEASLAERILVLRAAVQALREAPDSPSTRSRVQRRLHALGAAARTVGFFTMAVRICDAQSVLEAADELTTFDLQTLDELLDELPTLTQKDALPLAGMPRLDGTEPITAIVLGDATIEDLLRPERVATTSFASARFEDPSHVWATLHPMIPDVFVIDADLPGAYAFVAALVEDARTELVPILAIGRFETRDDVARYLALGVTRTFTKPATGSAVRGAAQDAVEQRRGHTVPNELRIGTLPPPPVRRAAPKAAPVVTTAASGPPIPTPMLFIARRLVAGDDDPVVAWFVADHFRKMGAHVDEALSGQATLARALDVDRSVPDLVFADLGMRDLDGGALVRALRSDPAARDVPVLLQSWKEERLEEAREAGITAALLSKSATPEELTTKAAELLAPHARLRARLRAGGTLTGSLESVTVLRLLGMAQETARSVRIAIRDGAFTHELFVMGGALRRVIRRSPDGRIEHGARAIATALGVSSGTFTIEDARAEAVSPCGVAFVVDAVRASRALAAAARGAHLPNVAEVRFDQDVAHAVARLTGKSKEIAQRLTGGSSPRAMIHRADCDAAALEEVLVVLCRQGFVTAVREESPHLHEPRPAMLLEAAPTLPTHATLPTPPATPEPPATVAVQETTLPLLLRRQRAILAAPAPIVVEKAAPPAPVPSPGLVTLTPLLPLPISAPPTAIATLTATATMTASAIRHDMPDMFAVPEPSISVPITFEDPQHSRPLVVAPPPPPPALLLPPPAPPPPPPTFASPLPSLPPPPATPFTLSPPPGLPSFGSLSMPVAPSSAFDVPMPAMHLREGRDGDAAPPATSVTNRPPSPETRRKVKRIGVAVAVATVAVVAGAGVRWTVAAPPPRAAAARPATTLSQASVPAQGLLDVSAADGLEIQVDGAPRGHGPKLSVSLPEGTHEVKTDGPNAKTRLVEIARGKVTHVDLAWRPAPIPPTR